MSIICFKRCPFLRSYLTELFRAVWLSGTIPDEWKKACTILIHKKDDTNSPSNFRPITLETIPLKVFTSCIRNSIFTFLIANNFIESNIQKGFTPHVSGTLEHIAQMDYIINQARIKQRSLVITLLDLKNAFGEINHNLIKSVLGYHHIPDHIKVLIKGILRNPDRDSDSDLDSDSKKIRTREKPGLVLGLAFKKPGLDNRKPGLQIENTGFDETGF